MVTQRAPGLLREGGHAKALGSSKHLGVSKDFFQTVWMISPCFTWKSTCSVDNYYNKVTFRYIQGISIACKKNDDMSRHLCGVVFDPLPTPGWRESTSGRLGFCELLDTWRYGDFLGKKNIELEKDVDKWNCLDRFSCFQSHFWSGFPTNPAGESSTVKKMHSLASKSGIHRTELHLPHYLMAIACEKHGKSRGLGLSFSITVWSIPKIRKIPSNWISTGDIPTINSMILINYPLVHGKLENIPFDKLPMTVKPPCTGLCSITMFDCRRGYENSSKTPTNHIGNTMN